MRACLLLVLAFSLPVATAEPPTVSIDSEVAQEMSALISDTHIQGLLQKVEAMTPGLREDLVELTQIPAPPFGEENRALHFAEMLRDAGLTDVTIDGVGNVIGRRRGKTGDRVVAYTAHLDTVFPVETDVTVRTEGNTFYAPGIGDNTRGLVVILAVLRAMELGGIETDADVLFVGSVGEEGLVREGRLVQVQSECAVGDANGTAV